MRDLSQCAEDAHLVYSKLPHNGFYIYQNIYSTAEFLQAVSHKRYPALFSLLFGTQTHIDSQHFGIFIRTRATEFKEPPETRICVQLLHHCFVFGVFMLFDFFFPSFFSFFG